MRFLLAIMAMTFFAVSVGCDAPAEPKTDPPKTTEGSGDKAEGSDTKAEGSDTKAEGSGDKAEGASTEAANSETRTVSLKLPGMT